MNSGRGGNFREAYELFSAEDITEVNGHQYYSINLLLNEMSPFW